MFLVWVCEVAFGPGMADFVLSIDGVVLIWGNDQKE